MARSEGGGWRRLFGRGIRPSPVEREVEEEIRFHLEERTARLVASGMSPEEAAREAGRRFGNVDDVRRRMEAMTRERRSNGRRSDALGDLRQDVRFARRQLLRSPVFTAVAVLTLGLGIGATTAIYSVVDGIMLKPLPFPEAEELVAIWADYTRREGPAREWLSYPNFADLVEQADGLEAAAVYGGGPATLTGRGEAEQVLAAAVSEGMFPRVLRVAPAVGRGFDASEHQPDGPRAALLSHGLWERAFGADPGVLGSAVSLNGEPHTVVGVMPRDFRPPFLPGAELWRPAQIDPANPPCGGRGCAVLRGIGRMSPATTLASLRTEATTIANRLERAYPEANTGVGFNLMPLKGDMISASARALWVLLGAVGFVLLVACVNVANLMLGRAAARRGEMAVRSALGAGGSRIIRQLLTESVLLALLGGALGVALGWWTTRVLVAIAPAGTPRIDEVALDLRVLGVMALVTITSGLLFGTLPALRAARRDLNHDLRESASRGGGGGRGQARLRGTLVVAQVALALVLTTGAGLLIRSFGNLRQAELGFGPEGVTTSFLALPDTRYPDREAVRQFYESLEEQVLALPGVTAAGAVSTLPLSGFDSDVTFRVEGRPAPPPGQQQAVWYRSATPGYFEAMGIDIVAGRGIFASDDGESAPVVVINETLANRQFAGENPVGRRLNVNSPDNPVWREIVGVARDVRNFGIRDESRDALYLPFAQRPVSGLFLTVRSGLPTESMAQALRSAVGEADPALALASIRSMQDIVDDALASDRFTTLLLSLFAGVALALAVVGIYGVLSYAVSTRSSEIGLRIALGGSVRSVTRLVVGRSLALVGTGVVVGLAGVFLVTRALGALLYGVSPTDPLTLASVVALLAGVSALASIHPARRAGRVDPSSVLKAD